MTAVYDPYRTGTPAMRQGSVAYAMAYDSIAKTSWTPKESAGRYSVPIVEHAPTASKVEYISKQLELNGNVRLRHGGRSGFSQPRSTSAATFTWADPGRHSRPPSAVLERMYDELMAPVTRKTLDPFFAPLPSDLPRSAEEHASASQAALGQHRLRTRVSSRLIAHAPNGSTDCRPSTVHVASALGDVSYHKCGPLFLRGADGGRKVLNLVYSADAQPAGAEAAAPASAAAEQPPPAGWKLTAQVQSGYRPRSAADFSLRALTPLDGSALLQAARKPAPEHLRQPAHPRRKAQISTVRPYGREPLGAWPDGYGLVSDELEKPAFMRTSKERVLLAASRPATVGAH